MLNEAIFLATCNATIANEKPFKLQRGCHTFAAFFTTCNAYNNKQDGGRARRAKDELWLAHSNKIALPVAEGMLHASNLSRNVVKSRVSFYFSCNSQRNNCSCKMGCYTWIFSCNLQEKLLCVTWPLKIAKRQRFEMVSLECCIMYYYSNLDAIYVKGPSYRLTATVYS